MPMINRRTRHKTAQKPANWLTTQNINEFPCARKQIKTSLSLQNCRIICARDGSINSGSFIIIGRSASISEICIIREGKEKSSSKEAKFNKSYARFSHTYFIRTHESQTHLYLIGSFNKLVRVLRVSNSVQRCMPSLYLPSSIVPLLLVSPFACPLLAFLACAHTHTSVFTHPCNVAVV